MKRKRKYSTGRLLLWAVLILVPVLAYIILWVYSGIAPWNIDAWNSKWNDEMEYYRVAQLMRTYLTPQGVAGYNEVLNHHLCYGAYTPFTYLIYAAFSFLTGYRSHNFMYVCNILMALLGNLVFVLLVKPDRKRAGWMIAFFCCNLLWLRHTWSGMVEESYSMYMVIFAGLVLYENQPDDRIRHPMAGIAAMVLLTAYFSVMRPYYVLLLLFPLFYFIRLMRGKRPTAGTGGNKVLTIAGSLVILAMIPALLYAFVYMRNNYVAIYFSSSPNTVENFLHLLFGGDIAGSIGTIVHANTHALEFMRENAHDVPFCFAIFMIDAIEWILLLLLLVRAIAQKKKDGRQIFTLVMYLLFSLAVYEATIILYSPEYVHRMTEATALAAGLVIIYYAQGPQRETFAPCTAGTQAAQEKTFRKGSALGVICEAALLCVTLAVGAGLLVQQPSRMTVPAKSDISLSADQQQAIEEKYEQIMPYDDSGDPWNNTLARPLILTKYYNNLFPVPVYISMNTFKKGALKDAIVNGTLKSKYLMLDLSDDQKELRQLAESRYEVIGVFDYVEILLVHP